MNFAKVNSEKANEIFLTARGCTGPTLPLVRHVLWDATQQCGLFLPLKKMLYTQHHVSFLSLVSENWQI